MTVAGASLSPPNRRTVDILILGGGVAGSALAITLARDGMQVALVEREPFFRDRIRGESIHPWGVRELTELGLRELVIDLANGRELPFWTRYHDGGPGAAFAWTDLVPGSPGEISVRHPQLQEALIQTAANTGVEIFRPARASPRQETGTLGATITEESRTVEIACRLLVGADGQRSTVRSWIGGTGRRDPVHHAIAGAIVSGLTIAQDSAHQVYFPGGFAMIFPQAGETNRIYYVCSSERARDLKRSQLPDALIDGMRDWLPEGTIGDWTNAGPSGFFPNAEIVVDRIHNQNVVLIGDAAGANDPSQGHGLSLAFRDVRGLRDLLRAEPDDSHWNDAIASFATDRLEYFEVLRQHARWSGPLMTDTGPQADLLRARVTTSRALDPSAGGFAAIFITGPDGLVADDAARRHFLGEDLDNSLKNS